jgi:hypothetical protein
MYAGFVKNTSTDHMRVSWQMAASAERAYLVPIASQMRADRSVVSGVAHTRT